VIRLVARGVRYAARLAVQLGRRLWAAHLRLLRRNAAYATAVATAAGVVVTREHGRDLLTTLVVAVFTVYSAANPVGEWLTD
jgi:hypothetical protein